MLEERSAQGLESDRESHGSTDVVGGRAATAGVAPDEAAVAALATTAPGGASGDVAAGPAAACGRTAKVVGVRGLTIARARTTGRTRSLMSGIVDLGTVVATVVGVATTASEPPAVGEVAGTVAAERDGTVGAGGIVGAETA